MFKHSGIAARYHEEGRELEANREEQDAKTDMIGLLTTVCPLLCCSFLGAVVLMSFWIWGVVEAGKNSHDTCGSGPTVFWVMFAVFIFILFCCGCCGTSRGFIG